MNTLVDQVQTAVYQEEHIQISMQSGVEIRFPISDNPRLSQGSPQQLGNIEVSPYGLHWPDLDEDLSFRGILEGDFGQSSPCRAERDSL